MRHLSYSRSVLSGQRGVTGLETAIILIAFVVVASVFAFTVLSTGIFSAERGKETIHAGLRGARSSLELKGSVVAEGVTNKTLSTGDSVWTSTGAATSTVTADTTDKKEGTASADILISVTTTVGLVAYKDLDATIDLSKLDSISLWVKASGMAAKTTLSTADSAWTGLTNVTSTANTSDAKEGTASANLLITAAFATGTAAYEDLSSAADFTSIDSVRLWVKSSIATSLGDIEIILDDSTACGTALESIDIPALTANTWTQVSLTISDNTDMSAIACVGLNVITDNGLQTVNLDDIYGEAQTTATGDLELVVDNTAACGSPLENIDIPSIVTGDWARVTLAITDNSDMTAIKCVGLNVATDNGSHTVNLDKILAQGQATALLVTLTNTLEGEPIDLREPGDSDANGVADTDSTHTLILTYNDKNQQVRDLYWTKVFVGSNDGDNLLEAGEKVELNVRVTGLSNANPVIGDTKFDLELRPESGGTVVIERTMPDIIDAVMNLN